MVSYGDGTVNDMDYQFIQELELNEGFVYDYSVNLAAAGGS